MIGSRKLREPDVPHFDTSEFANSLQARVPVDTGSRGGTARPVIQKRMARSSLAHWDYLVRRSVGKYLSADTATQAELNEPAEHRPSLWPAQSPASQMPHEKLEATKVALSKVLTYYPVDEPAFRGLVLGEKSDIAKDKMEELLSIYRATKATARGSIRRNEG